MLAHRVALGDGWRLDLPDTVAYCTLTASPQGWKVTSVTFADSTSSAVTP